MKKNLLIFFITLLISFSACNYFESDNPTGITQIELNISNLKPLPDSLVYVGWITTNADSSFKIFERNVDQNGIISVSTTNEFNGLQKAQQFKVTVEEIPDTGSITSPGNNVIISGRFTLGAAHLKVGEGNSLSTSLPPGIYTITTPTDTLDNNLSGVWFVDSLLRVGGPIAGLNLPVLHEGWFYESLIILNQDTLSIGTFTDPESADDFAGYSSTAPGYPFPGEDFLINPPPNLTFPLDLSNAKVIIKLDYISVYPLSFTYVVLEGTIPAGVQANTANLLQGVDAQVPTGLVSIKVDIVE